MKNHLSTPSRHPSPETHADPGTASLMGAAGDHNTPRVRLRRRLSQTDRGVVAGRGAARSQVGTKGLASANPSEQLESRPASEAATLEALMQRYQSADSEAANELIERLSPMLFRFFAGPPETRGHAEDMLQDCWLRIHRARHTYRPGSALLPWVFAIARHTRVDAYRRRSRIGRHETAHSEIESFRSEAINPFESSSQALWDLVQELPESQQRVVTMLKVAGMSLKETARATGSTVGAVKQKAHRAYGRLRKLLAAQGLGSRMSDFE